MEDIIFCDVKYIKANTTIEQNVDDNKILPFILKVQDTHLQQALGTVFYNHLKNAVQNDTLTQLERDFITNYVQKVVSEYTFFEGFPFVAIKLTDKGVVEQNSDNSTNADLTKIKFMRSAILDMAQFYLKRLNKYLCDYGNLFSQYYTSEVQNVNINSKSYFSGIYLRGSGQINQTDQYKNNK
jgi:hypothetical protein